MFIWKVHLSLELSSYIAKLLTYISCLDRLRMIVKSMMRFLFGDLLIFSLKIGSKDVSLDFQKGEFMAWLYLFVAGLLEIAWPIGFKYSKGFTKILPTIPTALALMLSFYLLSKASKTLPIGRHTRFGLESVFLEQQYLE